MEERLDKYKRSGHAIYDIQYHIIWCTKYRYPILTGDIGLRARDLLRQIAMAREVTIIRGAIAPDHIHMLVAGSPSLAPSKLVQYLKGCSSRKLQEEFSALRKKYWGQHLWARGYFCSTVGNITDEMVKQYIETQKWEEDGDESFRVLG